MHVRSVTTPSGQSYDVAVEWLPRWRLLAGRFSGWRNRRRQAKPDKASWLDNLEIPFSTDTDEFVTGIALTVGFIVLVVLFWWLLLPALLLVLDGLVVLLLLVAGALTRVVLRRPWSVLVRRIGGFDPGESVETRIQVIGWRRALRTRDAIADALTGGATVPAATSVTATLT